MKSTALEQRALKVDGLDLMPVRLVKVFLSNTAIMAKEQISLNMRKISTAPERAISRLRV